MAVLAIARRLDARSALKLTTYYVSAHGSVAGFDWLYVTYAAAAALLPCCPN